MCGGWGGALKSVSTRCRSGARPCGLPQVRSTWGSAEHTGLEARTCALFRCFRSHCGGPTTCSRSLPDAKQFVGTSRFGCRPPTPEPEKRNVARTRAPELGPSSRLNGLRDGHWRPHRIEPHTHTSVDVEVGHGLASGYATPHSEAFGRRRFRTPADHARPVLAHALKSGSKCCRSSPDVKASSAHWWGGAHFGRFEHICGGFDQLRAGFEQIEAESGHILRMSSAGFALGLTELGPDAAHLGRCCRA